MVRSLAGRQRGEATALPGWIKPQLTKLVAQPPDGPEWLHELKYDGYRMHARLDRGAVRLLTRTRLDWTHGRVKQGSDPSAKILPGRFVSARVRAPVLPVGPVKLVRWKPSRSIALSISRRLLSSVLPASSSRYSTGFV
jgi:hypothetical protein